MPHAYTSSEESLAKSYQRIHANSEQTHVHILSVGDSAYAAVAFDVDPREYEPVDAEIIAYDPTLDGVVARTDRWLETNPKGIASESSGGLWARLLGLLEHLDDYGTEMVPDTEETSE